METGVANCRNLAVVLASTFALWSAIPTVAGAAVPGSGIRSAIQNVAEQSNPVTNVRQSNCGSRCYTGRKLKQCPQGGSRNGDLRNLRRCCASYKHPNSRYSHYHCGWWYAWPYWSLGVPLFADTQNDYQYDDLHVAYCLGKYRSYNPATDTYLAYSGRYRRCRSPYSG